MHTNDRQGSAVGSFTTNSVLVGYENVIRRPGVFLRDLRMAVSQKVQHQRFTKDFPQTFGKPVSGCRKRFGTTLFAED